MALVDDPGRGHARVELDLAERLLIIGDVLLQDGVQRLRLLRAQVHALEVADLDLARRLLLQRAEDEKEVPNVHADLHAVGVALAVVLTLDQLDLGLLWIRHRDRNKSEWNVSRSRKR